MNKDVRQRLEVDDIYFVHLQQSSAGFHQIIDRPQTQGVTKSPLLLALSHEVDLNCNAKLLTGPPLFPFCPALTSSSGAWTKCRSLVSGQAVWPNPQYDALQSKAG